MVIIGLLHVSDRVPANIYIVYLCLYFIVLLSSIFINIIYSTLSFSFQTYYYQSKGILFFGQIYAFNIY